MVSMKYSYVVDLFKFYCKMRKRWMEGDRDQGKVLFIFLNIRENSSLVF